MKSRNCKDSERLTPILCFLFCLLALPGMAICETADIDPPELGSYGINATYPAVVADDWIAMETGWVTGLHFWGCWRSDATGQIDSFLVAIHITQSASQGTCAYQQPYDVLWQKTFSSVTVDSPTVSPEARTWCNPAEIEFLEENNVNAYPCYVQLDSADWLLQEMGDAYWLSISAVLADTSGFAWGLVSTLDHVGGHAGFAFIDEWDWITLDYYYVPCDANCDDVFDGADCSIYIGAACWSLIFPPFLFPGGEPHPMADADGNGIINISDCAFVIAWCQGGGPSPSWCYTYDPRDSLAAAIVVETVIAPWICGDPDRNELVNVSDAVYLINFIFGGGPNPDPLLSGDVNCNSVVNISDAVYSIAYIFGGGPAPCATCL